MLDKQLNLFIKLTNHNKEVQYTAFNRKPNRLYN